jgi:hypothetical protein
MSSTTLATEAHPASDDGIVPISERHIEACRTRCHEEKRDDMDCRAIGFVSHNISKGGGRAGHVLELTGRAP